MDKCEDSAEMKEWWTELEKLMSMNVDQKQEIEKAITTHLLTKNDFLSEIRDSNGNGILHYIAKFDSALITNYCISKNCDVNLLNNDENPPLAMAVECNNLETVKALIEAGAIHDHFYFKRYKGPLHIAAENKHVDMTKYLINIGANVNAYTSVPHEEQTLLNLVCSNVRMGNSQDAEIVQALIDAGADVNARDNFGCTPLFNAINNGCNNVIELLLNAGASYGITNNKGQLPLVEIQSDDVNVEIIKRFIASESEVDRNLWDGRTGLYYAVASILPKTVKCMLENGASVNIFDFRHLDPLSFAFFEWERNYSAENDIEKCLESITLLLNHDFDLNRANKYGMTPFYHALQSGCNEKILFLLLDRGAEFDFDNKIVQMTISGNRNPKVSKVLLKFIVTHDLRDRNGEPFHFKSLHLDKELQNFYTNLKINLEKGPLNDEVLLTYPNESAQPESSWFVELKKLTSHKNKQKQNTEKAIIDHLMTRKDFLPEIRDDHRNGVLHYVAAIDSAFVANFCIVFGCNVNSLNDVGNPPLAIACQCNNLETVKVFIEAGAIHDNYYFAYGGGPLEIAVKNKHFDTTKYLISIDADVNTYKKSTSQESLLHSVCWSYEKRENNQCIEIVKTLIDAGAHLNEKDNYGNTPLFTAEYLTIDDVIELLLNAGAQVNVKNFIGQTPLHYIDNITVNSERSVKRFIEADVDVNLTDVYGRTPIYYVIKSLSPTMLRIFLKHGATVDVFDHEDLDLLSFMLSHDCFYVANNNNFLECIKLLLEYGVDVNRVNRDGITPLSMALLQNCPIKVVTLLLTRGAIVDLNNVAVQKTMKKYKDPLVPQLLIKYIAILDSQNQNDESTNLTKLSREQLKVYSNCKVELNFMKMIYFVNSSISYFDCLADKIVRAHLDKQQVSDIMKNNLVQIFLPNYGELLIERFSDLI